MDEINNNQMPAEQPQQESVEQQNTVEPQAPAQNVENTAPANSTAVNYASFGARFVALFIDGVILGIINFILGAIAAPLGDSAASLVSMLGTLIGWAYFIYLDVAQGATLGKKVMHLRVQKTDTGENLNYVEAFLREVVGRILSSIVLFLGYFWMLWDDKKQTWHDKVANSVVVKVN